MTVEKVPSESPSFLKINSSVALLKVKNVVSQFDKLKEVALQFERDDDKDWFGERLNSLVP